MLAKVLKKQDAVQVAAYSIPEIGSSAPANGITHDFVVPDAHEFHSGVIGGNSPDDILQQARDEAARIIAHAEENSSIIEQVAQDKALHAANAKFEAEVSAKISEIRGRLTETIEQISGLSEEITTRAETQLVELAVMIAKKIVGREVKLDREVALTLVKVSLAKLHDRSVAEVRLNPEDFAFVQSYRDKLGFRGALDLVDDPLVSVGGCLIHTETGDIDARIESQFDEIAHGLLEV